MHALTVQELRRNTNAFPSFWVVTVWQAGSVYRSMVCISKYLWNAQGASHYIMTCSVAFWARIRCDVFRAVSTLLTSHANELPPVFFASDRRPASNPASVCCVWHAAHVLVACFLAKHSRQVSSEEFSRNVVKKVFAREHCAIKCYRTFPNYLKTYPKYFQNHFSIYFLLFSKLKY